MTLNPQRRVGVFAGDLSLGNCGGTEIYTHELVGAILEYRKLNDYAIMANQPVSAGMPASLAQCLAPLASDVRGRSFLFDQMHWWCNSSLRASYACLADFRMAGQFDDTCRSAGIGLVHFPATLIPERLCKTQTPKALTFFDAQHEYYPDNFTREQLERRRRAYRLSIESARCIIAPSLFTRQTLIEKYQVSEDRISLIPVGVSSAFKRASNAVTEAVRAKYNLPGRYLFYPANPWPHKNHSRLMAAFKLFMEKGHKDVKLVLSGRLKNETMRGKNLAVSAGLDSSVVDLGFISFEDLCGLYSGAEALIFPSQFEGFGIPVLEAMACGCPMALAQAASLPEVGGDAALYFDPMKVEEIAAAMTRLATDGNLRSELAAKGNRRVEEFRWSRIVPRLEKVYAGVLGGSERE